MKELLLVRHAKSSWELDVEDRNRPLTQKGMKRIKQMVLFNPEIFSSAEIIFSSTANRAVHTTLIMANSLGLPFKIVSLSEELYTFKASDLIHFIKNISDKYERVICVGHNPAFTLAASYFSTEDLDHLPTASWAQIQFEQNEWEHIQNGQAQIGLPKDILK